MSKPSLPQNGDIRDWAEKYLHEKKHPYLLAFADDGVIWGKKTKDGLLLSHDIDSDISPDLLQGTLQQASVFGEESEFRLFKTEKEEEEEEDKWDVLEIKDSPEIIKESQILWGSRALETTDEGFTQVFDARQQGLDHIVPIKVANSDLDLDEDGTKCIRLDVHHLVEYDEETGEARIAASRLAGIRLGKKNEEVK